MAQEQRLLGFHSRIRQTILWSRMGLIATLLIRGVVIALLISTFWGFTSHSYSLGGVWLGLWGLTLSFVWGLYRLWPKEPSEAHALMHLEINNPQTSHSAFSLRTETNAEDWESPMQRSLKLLRGGEGRRILDVLNTTAIPALFLVICSQIAPGAISANLRSARSALVALASGASLRILDGSPDGIVDKDFKLTARSHIELELLSDNMIEITSVVPADGPTPKVELHPLDKQTGKNDNIQTFQMSPQLDGTASPSGLQAYTISLAVSDSSELFVSSVSDLRAVATVKVKALPVPKVHLSSAISPEETWPDDKPIPLDIEVHGSEPIQLVSLIVTIGKKSSREVVSRVVAEDKRNLNLNHSLVLEPYMEEDMAEVEITAEAVDRALPKPLVGLSEPLRFTVASAYGRYKQALNTLAELKRKIDDHLNKQDLTADPEWRTLADKAEKQSEQSPFFDGFDRAQIMRFSMQTKEITEKAEASELIDLSNTLNNFLFEHEIIDDRERDRDFFVAIRTFSRVLEQEKGERPVSAKTVASRILGFLTERERRWKLRVERLSPDSRPSMWSHVSKDHPYHQAVEKAASLDAAQAKVSEEGLMALTQSTTDYRKWIEELEAKEDEARNKEDQKRQEGLASAKNEIRDLQRRQAVISDKLDKADQRQKDDLNRAWASARMEQNTNIQGTKSLEAKMRALSPQASERIKAAVESMGKTIEKGNDENFTEAESYSDMSSRLLRQAERAASESQARRPQRGRRRRTAGDNYYGQSIVGGDVEIKREYQVDKRYREDILNEVRDADVDSEERKILDGYLREVVR